MCVCAISIVFLHRLIRVAKSSGKVVAVGIGVIDNSIFRRDIFWGRWSVPHEVPTRRKLFVEVLQTLGSPPRSYSRFRMQVDLGYD